MTVIDAHQHYWDPARGDYGWMTPGSPLDRRFLPGELEPLLRDGGVAGTVLVQAAPTLAETDWLLDLAARTPSVMGVVGWIDLDDPGGAAAAIAERVPRGLVGIRPMLQDLPDPEWILDDARAAAVRAAAGAGMVFDALVRPEGLAAVAELAGRHPGLTVVLDHAGKPPVGSDGMDRWWRGVERLAAHPNCRCKLSGLLTEAPDGTPRQAIVDLVRRIAALWGPERLIWGSDWPVLTLAGGYGEWLALAREGLGEWNGAAKARVFGGNARAIYGREPGRRVALDRRIAELP